MFGYAYGFVIGLLWGAYVWWRGKRLSTNDFTHLMIGFVLGGIAVFAGAVLKKHLGY